MLIFNAFWQKLKKRRESGLALIQVLLMATMLAGAVSFSVLQNSKTTQKVSHDIYAQDLRLLTERIQSVVANQPDCTDLITPTGFNNLAVGTSISVSELTGTNLLNFLVVTDAGTLTPRYGAQEKISLTAINISRTTITAGVLTLNFRIDDDDVLGIREFAKTIPMVFIGTAATITSCHANPDDMISDSVKRFCQGPGAVYYPETNQCFIIGFYPQSCDPGNFVKGLSYDPSTMMVTSVCEPISGLTYDTVGCIGDVGVPVGFDADGDIICTRMSSKNMWPLVNLTQQNEATMDCTTRITKLNPGASTLSVICPAATATNTATATPTPTNTPSHTASATATNTPTVAPTTVTPTPTYTSTPSTPTATPTAGGGGGGGGETCLFTGQPTAAYYGYASGYTPGGPLDGGVWYNNTDYFRIGNHCSNNASPTKDLDANLSFTNANYDEAFNIVFTDQSNNECRIAMVVSARNDWISFPAGHGHAHHAGVAHNHCNVYVNIENANAWAWQTMGFVNEDLEHGSNTTNSCLTNVAYPTFDFRVRLRIIYGDLGAGATAPGSCAQCNTASYSSCSVGGGCCNQDFISYMESYQIHFSYDGGATWTHIGTMSESALNDYCGGGGHEAISIEHVSN